MAKKEHRRAIVIPDVHFPIQDDAAVNVVLKAIKMVKPNIFVCLGDLGEWKSVSPWRYKRRKRPPLEYTLEELKVEAAAVNDGLDLFDNALRAVGCTNKHMIEGNHDDWLNSFVDEFPYLPEYKFKNVMNLKERGYKYYPYGHLMQIGKLFFYHGGHYSTVNHTRQHVQNLGKNIVYGHTHDVQRHTLTKLDSGTIAAWSMGCLKNMSGDKNKWLRGRLHNWCHAFGIITWQSNGNFQIEVIDIQKGKASVWGQEIVAN